MEDVLEFQILIKYSNIMFLNKFTIDKGIPVPKKGSGGKLTITNIINNTLSSMVVGDSFVMPIKHLGSFYKVLKQGTHDRTSFKYSSLKESNEIRVFKIL